MAKTTTPRPGQEREGLASKGMLDQAPLRIAAITSFCTAAGTIAATQTGLVAVVLVLVLAAVVLTLALLDRR